MRAVIGYWKKPNEVQVGQTIVVDGQDWTVDQVELSRSQVRFGCVPPGAPDGYRRTWHIWNHEADVLVHLDGEDAERFLRAMARPVASWTGKDARLDIVPADLAGQPIRTGPDPSEPVQSLGFPVDLTLANPPG